MPAQSIVQLKSSFRGELIQSEDAVYESARKVYNGMIDKRPRLIARCVDVADVMAAVEFGRENDLLTAIRGGGHNGAGLGTCDDGLVIDLSRMKGIRVDPAAKTVRVEAGCVWGDVDHATHAFGMAVPCGFISTTGVGRPHPGRRYRLPDPPVRADDRQSALRGHGSGRWELRDGEQRRESGPVLGGARRRWKLRGGHFVRISSSIRSKTVQFGPTFWPLEEAATVLERVSGLHQERARRCERLLCLPRHTARAHVSRASPS